MTFRDKLFVILGKSDRSWLLCILVGTLIAGLLEMIGVGSIPAFVGLLVDPDWLFSSLFGSQRMAGLHELQKTNVLLYGAGLLCVFFLFKNLYVVTLIYGETRLAQSLAASLSNRLFRAYLHTPYHFHLQRNPADLIKGLTEETVYAMQFVRAGMRLMREGLVLALVLGLMVVVEPTVSLAVFALLSSVSGCFYAAVRRVLSRRGELCKDHWGRRVQVISQTFGAIKDVKILGREAHFMKVFGMETAGLQHHQTFYEVTSAFPRYFLEMLAIAAVVPIASTYMLLDKPLIGLLPMLTLFGVAVVRFVPAMTTINTSLVDIRYRRSAFDWVAAELDTFEIPISVPARDHRQRPSKRIRESIT